MIDPDILTRRRDHAISRALERCGVPLSIPEYEVLNLQIFTGKATFLWRQSHTRTHWAVRCQGRVLHALYHSGFHMITTFLPDGEKTRERLQRFTEEMGPEKAQKRLRSEFAARWARWAPGAMLR